VFGVGHSRSGSIGGTGSRRVRGGRSARVLRRPPTRESIDAGPITSSAVGANRIHLVCLDRTNGVAGDVLGAIAGGVDSNVWVDVRANVGAHVALCIRVATVMLGHSWVTTPWRKIGSTVVWVAAWVVLQPIGATWVDVVWVAAWVVAEPVGTARVRYVWVAAWVVAEPVGATRVRYVWVAAWVVAEPVGATRMWSVRWAVVITSRVISEPVVTTDVEWANPVECTYRFELDASGCAEGDLRRRRFCGEHRCRTGYGHEAHQGDDEELLHGKHDCFASFRWLTPLHRLSAGKCTLRGRKILGR